MTYLLISAPTSVERYSPGQPTYGAPAGAPPSYGQQGQGQYGQQQQYGMSSPQVSTPALPSFRLALVLH